MSDSDYQEKFNKGWSLSSVYNFSEMRDVHLAIKLWDSKKFDLDSFFSYCLSISLPYVKTEWNKRRLLEHVNALKNFSLLNEDYKTVGTAFSGSEIGSELSIEDTEVFKEIYFSYFRFKEIFAWFLSPNTNDAYSDWILSIEKQKLEQESYPLYCFSNESRFTDAFIHNLEDNPIVYFINENDADLMRFWDVFIKWGATLGIIEKFNLKSLDVKTINNKQISCVYIINSHYPDINLLEYIKKHFSDNYYIYIPELVFKLITSFRVSISTAQKLIIEQYKIHKKFLSFERTSEIFIKKEEIKNKEKILFLKHNDSYISHLIVRR